MSKLIIRKQKRESVPVKPCNIYVDTHEKLNALSQESGISIVRLIAILVDYGLENLEVIDDEK